MEHRWLRQWMGGVALAAMLLLAAVPTLGRLAGTDAAGALAHAAAGHASAPAHAAGHDTGAHHARSGDRAPARRPVPFPHHGGDCDYCPLLAALATPAPVALPPASGPVFRFAIAPPADPATRWRHPAGLGSRGPPSAS